MKKYVTIFVLLFIAFFPIYAMEEVSIHNEEIAIHNENQLKPIVENAKLVIQNKSGTIPNFIAIAGGTGIGKSFLAEELADLLAEEGITAAILRCDDFLDPDHDDPNHFHNRFQHLLAHSVIQQIKSGKKVITKPAWNPEKDQLPAKVQEEFSLEKVDVVIFEGEFTLCEQEPYNFIKYSDFGIFVDADDEDIMEWNWQRGRSDTKNTTKEEYKTRIKPYLLKYRDFVKSCSRSALYLLLKDSNHQYRVHKKIENRRI